MDGSRHVMGVGKRQYDDTHRYGGSPAIHTQRLSQGVNRRKQSPRAKTAGKRQQDSQRTSAPGWWPTAVTTFDEARKELRSKGVTLTAPPGAYTVSKVGMPDTVFATEDLAEAIARGRAIAALNQALRQLPALAPMGSKSTRRARMYKHNRAIAQRRSKKSGCK